MSNPGSHREPFCIPAAHPALAGHFPGNPVVPGVLLLDHVLDAVQRRFGLGIDALRLPQVKFLQPLVPEQAAEIVLEPMTADPVHADPANSGQTRIRFRIERDGALLTSGELIASTLAAHAAA